MSERLLELYQAEWCPYSHEVRARLTELGISFIARQVPADSEERDELRRVAGTDEIPTVVLGDGSTLSDADRIIEYLNEHYGDSPGAERHREQAAAHADG